jgi:hypothetical protein
VRPPPVVVRHAQQAPACRIQRAHDRVGVHHEETGRQARDDLLAPSFRRFGARLHGAFLATQAADGILHRAGHQLRLPPGVAPRLPQVARRANELEDGVREDGREAGDDGREAEEQVA